MYMYVCVYTYCVKVCKGLCMCVCMCIYHPNSNRCGHVCLDILVQPSRMDVSMDLALLVQGAMVHGCMDVRVHRVYVCGYRAVVSTPLYLGMYAGHLHVHMRTCRHVEVRICASMKWWLNRFLPPALSQHVEQPFSQCAPCSPGPWA